jgi:hypothetical protein
VRVMDMQTDVRRSAGLAAIAQALVVALADSSPDRYDRRLYTRRRAEAAAGPPAAADVEALGVLVEPVARSLGSWHLAEPVLTPWTEAERQLDVAAAEGIAAVPRDVVQRTALAF